MKISILTHKYFIQKQQLKLITFYMVQYHQVAEDGKQLTWT